MVKLKGKKLFLGMLILSLFITACAPAFASVGDRVLYRNTESGGYDDTKILNLFPYGDGFAVFTQKNHEHEILLYADAGAQPETFIWDDHALSDENEDDRSVVYAENWFGWNDGIYAIIGKTQYSDDSGHTEFFVKKARLESERVVLENADLPELDLTCLVAGEEGAEYVQNIANLYTFSDKLIIVLGEDMAEDLEVINLKDGFCTEIDIDDCEVVPGPAGTLLMTKAEWNERDNIATVQILGIDTDGGNEKLLAEIPGCNSGMIAPCYDPEKDTLYFVRNGELCAMPQFDPEKIEAVNNCNQAGNAAYMLSDGFILMKTYDSVMIKNTDPAQRGNVTLRVLNDIWGREVMAETVSNMNNVRGDISVVLQESEDVNLDILQAVLTRDSSFDIYMLHYDSNEFSALRNRDYLPDLSGNDRISANINRMYPYLQDAMKQNGKIIGVPVQFSSGTIGINKELWRQIGGTEEELPKTWSRFFDWIGTLPERLEGKEVSFIGGTDRAYFRGEVLHMLMNQYEVLMERKGEKEYVFASPELIALVQQLNDVNYDALRVSDHWHWEEDDTYENPEAMKPPLLQLGVSALLNGQNEFTPLALSLWEGEDAVLPVELHMAFLNPYSNHQEEAAEFLALAMDHLDFSNRYTAYADQTEPVRFPDYEEDMKWFEEVIEELKANKETAKDEEQEEIEESIRRLEKNRKHAEENSWMISAQAIERYQKWQNLYKVQGYTFFNDLFTAENDEERYEEFEKIFRNMEDAKRNPKDILEEIDRRTWMIRSERN